MTTKTTRTIGWSDSLRSFPIVTLVSICFYVPYVRDKQACYRPFNGNKKKHFTMAKRTSERTSRLHQMM